MATFCSLCFDKATVYVSCKGFSCNTLTCKDCMEHWIDMCFEQLNGMPSCGGCSCEIMYSQIKFIVSPQHVRKYEKMCTTALEYAKSNKPPPNQRNINDAIRDSVKKKVEKLLPPALARLLDITSIAKKVPIVSYKDHTAVNACQFRACVTFTCKGRMRVNSEDAVSCDVCGISVCTKCDGVKSDSHVCKDEEVKSVELLAGYTKCPKCAFATERIDGCVFVTCPICKSKFDSKTGAFTSQGNHDQLRLTLRQDYRLSELGTSESAKQELDKIQALKRTFQTASKQPPVIYEHIKLLEMYNKSINRLFEHKSNGSFNDEMVIKVKEYLMSL